MKGKQTSSANKKITRNYCDLPCFSIHTMCPVDTATAGSWAGQLRFGFVAVLVGHIVHISTIATVKLFEKPFIAMIDVLLFSSNCTFHT
jgi:hypothetical protein